MANGPYSSVYHCLADEHPDIYDGPYLADFVRLLVAADQAWPTTARWAGLASRKALAELETAGLIRVEAARYRVKGMDKRRTARREQAERAAAAKYARSTPASTPASSPTSTAQALPSKAEQSRAEQSSSEQGARADPLDLYYTLTVRPPSKTVADWLDRLESEHGAPLLGEQMVAAWTADPNVRDFLGRVEAACLSQTRRADKAAEEKGRYSELEYQREMARKAAEMSPEARAKADAALAEVAALVKDMP